jgi:hypothetical protein
MHLKGKQYLHLWDQQMIAWLNRSVWPLCKNCERVLEARNHDQELQD